MAPKKTLKDPIEALQKGEVASIYFICGESFPRQRFVKTLMQYVIGDDVNAFNFEQIDGKVARAADIIAMARTMPMLGGKRLVRVDDAHELKAETLNELLGYIEDPAPFSVLLFVGDKADMRLKFFSALKKNKGVVHRYDPLKERQASAWVSEEARMRKIKLSAGVANAIADAVGTDMGQLSSSIEQLDLYCGGKAISLDAVESLLAQTRHRSIFELTNAVGRGELRKALLIIHQMHQAKEPALRILAMLARHLRQLSSAHECVERGDNEKKIAETIGVHPFFVKDLVQQAKRFERKRLIKMHQALYGVDKMLKSSKLNGSIVMDRLVISLCAGT